MTNKNGARRIPLCGIFVFDLLKLFHTLSRKFLLLLEDYHPIHPFTICQELQIIESEKQTEMDDATKKKWERRESDSFLNAQSILDPFCKVCRLGQKSMSHILTQFPAENKIQKEFSEISSILTH